MGAPADQIKRPEPSARQRAVAAHQRISASAHQRISASAHQRISASAHQRISATIHPYLSRKHSRLARCLRTDASSMIENIGLREPR